MTKNSALYEFFNSFGIPFYRDTNVPNNATFPYGTYTDISDSFDAESNGDALTVNLWYRTESEAIPDAKAQELSDGIGIGGKVVRCDGGAIWIKRGSPWCQSLNDDSDPMIKRRYINVIAEFWTEN